MGFMGFMGFIGLIVVYRVLGFRVGEYCRESIIGVIKGDTSLNMGV